MGNDNVVDLSEVRAEKAEFSDSDGWTPLDALKRAIADIESGKFVPDRIYIACYRRLPDKPNTGEHNWYSAGLNTMSTLGLLTAHIHITNEDK
jgi:hypothetical protein